VNGPPEIRAALSKSLLNAILARPPGERDRMLRHLAPERRSEIERAGRLSWYDLNAHVDMLDGVHELLGPAGFRAFHRDLTGTYLEQPFLKTIADTGVRLVGLAPFTAVSWTPTGWRTAFRHAGELEFEKSQRTNEGWLRLKGMPPAVARSGSMVEGLAGTLEYVVALMKGVASISVQDFDRGRGAATFHIVVG